MLKLYFASFIAACSIFVIPRQAPEIAHADPVRATQPLPIRLSLREVPADDGEAGQVTFTIRPGSEVANPRDQIILLSSLTNRSDLPIEYIWSRSAQDYTIVVTRAGVTVPPTAEYIFESGMGSRSLQKVKPGMSDQIGISMSNWFDFSKPGTYSIMIARDYWTALDKKVTVTSNTAKLVVLKAPVVVQTRVPTNAAVGGSRQ